MTGILVFVLAFILLVVLIQQLAKAGVRGIEKMEDKRKEKDNVYIKGHMQMLRENKQHEEYLKWMDENNVPGVPFERVKSTEETKADNEIQKLFNKSR